MRRNAKMLRQYIRVRDEFTCKECGENPCPVIDQCNKVDKDDPRLKCNGKSDCCFQVHHKIPYRQLKHCKLLVLEEASYCELLCKSCHDKKHDLKK